MSTALITGAAGGIGRELARQLAERGTTVIATCRKSSADLAKLAVRVEEGIDIATTRAASRSLHASSECRLISSSTTRAC